MAQQSDFKRNVIKQGVAAGASAVTGVPINPNSQIVDNFVNAGEQAMQLSTFTTKTIQVGAVGGQKGIPKVVKVITGQAFLPMPQNISTNYAKDWGGESTMDLSGGVMNAAKDELIRMGYKAAETITPDRAFAEGRFQKGLALNEKRKLLFNSIDFRNFTFTVQFQPKNAGEQAQIQNWIRQVKIDSAPDLQGTAFFTFPNYFVLAWPELNNLFQTGPLACTDVEVNYTPDNVWSTHTDKMPTSTAVTLSFTEIELAVREKIEAGW